jgi:uncharacterized protein (DUF952 family)
METHIYTLVRQADWDAVADEYTGSADDRRDGFLHFSTAGQLPATAAKHRAGEAGLVIVEADVAALGAALVFEPPGSGRPGLFPHLYGALPLSAVTRVLPLPLGADGLHIFPTGFA